MILLYLELILQPSLGRNMEDQLIKKEFMGKNLLALSVMWKYMEQRSFPLTEEEYLMRLDDVANTLKCWGAVSHIRNSLEKLKERPRIGKRLGCSFFVWYDPPNPVLVAVYERLRNQEERARKWKLMFIVSLFLFAVYFLNN
ncbi:uncharacterized protein [Rutidosis leptorrhynchoides]|uniref:uncharacterized protein isoform X1 n=1 Tax=Rutidosis leptorrhynchoides TaxID=125765 RepID=UPI003A9952EE